MIEKQYSNLNEGTFPILFSDNVVPMQKEFIKKTNNSFFNEFVKLYEKNMFLKSQLNEILKEKNKLSQIIIKLEKEKKKKNKEGKEIELNDIMNINYENMIFYRKSKKVRRKKKDINYIYNCFFPNCNKSYPRKNSLNLHIKLKHKNDINSKNDCE